MWHCRLVAGRLLQVEEGPRRVHDLLAGRAAGQNRLSLLAGRSAGLDRLSLLRLARQIRERHLVKVVAEVGAREVKERSR